MYALLEGDAVDTTAAGATLSSAASRPNWRAAPAPLDAIAFGQRATAIAVTREGAQPSIPHRSGISA